MSSRRSQARRKQLDRVPVTERGAGDGGGYRPANAVGLDPGAAQQLSGRAVQTGQGEHKVLAAEIGVAEFYRALQGGGDGQPGGRGQPGQRLPVALLVFRVAPRPDGPLRPDGAAHWGGRLSQGGHVGAERLEHVGPHVARDVEHAGQQMLGAHGPLRASEIPGPVQRLPQAGRHLRRDAGADLRVPPGVERRVAEIADRLAGRADHPDRLGECHLADRRHRQARLAHRGGQVVWKVDVDLRHRPPVAPS